MSLFNEASFVLIPSGYKAGKLYSEKPIDGNGDLTWSRNSTATRTQSNGLIGSVGANVPRLSYMYGSCPAALLEPQRTNSMLNSELINSWPTKTELTITNGNAISPRGTQDASLIQQTIGGNTALLISDNISLSSGQPQCVSFYAKAKEITSITLRLGITTAWSGGIRPVFTLNLINGTSSSVSACTVTSQNVGNGWYRYIIQTAVTVAAASSNLQTTNIPLSANSGDGFYLWGVQWEQNANYATTYIPTTTATATRIADTFTRNNIYTNGLISASGGTWYVELKNNVVLTPDNGVIGFWLGTSTTTPNSNGSINFRQGGTSNRSGIFIYTGGASTFLYYPTNDNAKIAIKWNGTTLDIFANGTKVVTSQSFPHSLMENLTTTTVGRPFFIQAMALFNTPLSDTDCEGITGTSYTSFSSMTTALGYTLI